jgi:uncharacterized protein (TIGR03435 family)
MTLVRLVQHPLAQAIGYALIQFLWQGAFLSALLWAGGQLIRRSPNLRYGLGCLMLFSMPVVLGITTLRSFRTQHSATDSESTRGRAVSAARMTLGNSGDNRQASSERKLVSGSTIPREIPTPLAGWVACIWFAGVMALSMQMAGGWIRAQRLRTRLTKAASGVWTNRLEILRRRMEISRPVRLYMSALAEVPTVVGWLRPYVLLPVSAITGLDEDQWAAILAHELAHIRRHDYLINLLQTAVETILFYHPAVWWVSHRIREEREHCCDDLAVAACGNAVFYAGALARLEELRGVNDKPALAATGGDLLARVRRLTANNRKNTQPPRPLTATIATMLLVGVILGSAYLPAIGGESQAAPAQAANAAPLPASALKFDVASVKTCKEEPNTGNQRRREFTVTPGRANLDCITLERMIFFAYAGIGSMDRPLLNSHPADPAHVRGGPGWVRSEMFSIAAKAEGVSDREVMMGPMLRALLEERFQLKTHREMEEVPMYAMVVAKGGLKIQPIEPAGCTSPDAVADLAPEDRLAVSRSAKPICGGFTSLGDGVNGNWSLGGTTLSRFANSILSGVLDRYVLDKTGVTGLYNIRLQFALDESIRPHVFGGGRPADPPPPDIEKAPAIFSALEEQLGLKLEKTKAPREYLVIDRVERPSEN